MVGFLEYDSNNGHGQKRQQDSYATNASRLTDMRGLYGEAIPAQLCEGTKMGVAVKQ